MPAQTRISTMPVVSPSTWISWSTPEVGFLPAFGHGGSDGTLAFAIPVWDVVALVFTQSRGMG